MHPFSRQIRARDVYNAALFAVLPHPVWQIVLDTKQFRAICIVAVTPIPRCFTTVTGILSAVVTQRAITIYLYIDLCLLIGETIRVFQCRSGTSFTIASMKDLNAATTIDVRVCIGRKRLSLRL